MLFNFISLIFLSAIFGRRWFHYVTSVQTASAQTLRDRWSVTRAFYVGYFLNHLYVPTFIIIISKCFILFLICSISSCLSSSTCFNVKRYDLMKWPDSNMFFSLKTHYSYNPIGKKTNNSNFYYVFFILDSREKNQMKRWLENCVDIFLKTLIV